VPAGVTEIWAWIIPAGGGGGGGAPGAQGGTAQAGGGGGAAGVPVFQPFPVAPGDTISVVIGAGGPGGNPSTAGTAGGVTNAQDITVASPFFQYGIYAPGGSGGDAAPTVGSGLGGSPMTANGSNTYQTSTGGGALNAWTSHVLSGIGGVSVNAEAGADSASVAFLGIVSLGGPFTTFNRGGAAGANGATDVNPGGGGGGGGGASQIIAGSAGGAGGAGAVTGSGGVGSAGSTASANTGVGGGGGGAGGNGSISGSTGGPGGQGGSGFVALFY
jgi:hypothetical protein